MLWTWGDRPKKIFGSTKNLEKDFAAIEYLIPTSENAMTGIAIGSSLNGLRPIYIHQRLDFFISNGSNY